MKPICAEVTDMWRQGPGTTWLILKFDDDRVQESDSAHVSFIASNELGIDFEKGDHLTIKIRKQEK